MSQASKSTTTNRIQFASAGAVRRRPAPATATLVLPIDLADALAEMCTLTRYTDGFSYTDQMEAVCEYIADRSGPAAKLAYLARGSERERAIIQR
jgi:hypothetical protein